MGNQICEIMERDTYYLYESESIGDALEFLYHKEVSAVPVVSQEKEVVGYISDADILRHISGKKHHFFGLSEEFGAVDIDRSTAGEKLRDLLDMNLMTIASHKIITVRDDTEIELVAEIMAKKKLKKVAVIDDDDKLAGVVTRWTIVNHLMGTALRAADYR